MRYVTLGALALAVLPAVPAAAAGASDRHPWCMVVQDWGDGWSCGFDTFAQCQTEARAGNVGYCAANPNFKAPAPAKPSRQRRRPS